VRGCQKGGDVSEPRRQELLRRLPSVDELLRSGLVRPWLERLPRRLVVGAVRRVLDRTRRTILRAPESELVSDGELDAHLERELERALREVGSYRLRPVINATGVVLHTGLGRAPLARVALQNIGRVASGYCSLEVDLDTGSRGRRTGIVRDLLCELTGAESATVVNNNAAATLITLATLAAGKEVIVSRGELIEIGGSFRLPEIMAASGARLREVGTTNKTRLADYEGAIGPETGALLKVHTSNYRILGFTEAVPLEQLVRLGRRHNLPVVDDIGSGALLDLSRFGLTGEPVASHSVRSGADLVLFSGDKLLGGPQAGIIVGRKAWIEKIERHPLARAFRVGKLTLAALEATLRLYMDEEQALREVPALRMISEPDTVVRARAERLRRFLGGVDGLEWVELAQDTAYVGGGAVPAQGLLTWTVRVRAKSLPEDGLAARLRTGDPSVLARVQDGCVIFDARTLNDSEVELVAEAVKLALQPRADAP